MNDNFATLDSSACKKHLKCTGHGFAQQHKLPMIQTRLLPDVRIVEVMRMKSEQYRTTLVAYRQGYRSVELLKTEIFFGRGGILKQATHTTR